MRISAFLKFDMRNEIINQQYESSVKRRRMMVKVVEVTASKCVCVLLTTKIIVEH
jgi:hypothetical protein